MKWEIAQKREKSLCKPRDLVPAREQRHTAWTNLQHYTPGLDLWRGNRPLSFLLTDRLIKTLLSGFFFFVIRRLISFFPLKMQTFCSSSGITQTKKIQVNNFIITYERITTVTPTSKGNGELPWWFKVIIGKWDTFLEYALQQCTASMV